MPLGFQLGPLFIRYYGIILMVGAVLAAFLAEREVKRRGFNSDLVWDGLIWVLVGGIVGARIWHILTPPPSMVEQGITTGFYFNPPAGCTGHLAWRVGDTGSSDRWRSCSIFLHPQAKY